jgi:ribulose bisphosphate carboxylase small subunit
MNTYIVKIEIEAEVQAFNEDDAKEYISDIFGIDEEIKSIKVGLIQKRP